MIASKTTFYYLFLILCSSFLLFKTELMPGKQMILFHDETQGARVQEFAYNLKSFVLPPRMAPHFSFGMGYPVFNFYAPFAYWLTAGISLIGLDIADSLKLSFFIAVVAGSSGMILFLKKKYSSYAAIVGALFYISSPWIASEIFVRGNLGEIWFAALLPFMFYLLERNGEERSPVMFIATGILASWIFTVHNVLSYIFLPTVLVYLCFLPNRKRNFTAITMGLLLSSYFIIPAVIESQMTYASEFAAKTKYEDHFLCAWQIWTTNIWGFGGSANGCEADGMSFMLGKTQILTGAAGVLLYLFHVVWKSVTRGIKVAFANRRDWINVFFASIMAVAFFMAVNESKIIWDLFKPLMAVFQFPWRFLIIGLFGLSYFTAYLIHHMKASQFRFLVFFILLYIIIHNSRYFTGRELEKKKYKSTYLSEYYISTTAARKIPEYVPRSADMASWSLLDPTSPTFISVFDKSKTEVNADYEYYKSGKVNAKIFRLNILYFPYWKIWVNGREYDPQEFDILGRPIIKTDAGKSEVIVEYRQTHLQIVSNVLSALSLVVLLMLFLRREKSVFYKILF